MKPEQLQALRYETVSRIQDKLNCGFAGGLRAGSLGNEAGSYAPGADVNPLSCPLLYSLNPLEIGSPYLFRPIVGMADFVACLSPFSANLTNACHVPITSQKKYLRKIPYLQFFTRQISFICQGKVEMSYFRQSRNVRFITQLPP
jgi:hypothetical protein